MSGLDPGKVLPSEMDGRQWDRWNRGQALTLKLNAYTVATLPDALTHEREVIYVSDEVGGPTIAFSTGVDWRRVQDRAIVA